MSVTPLLSLDRNPQPISKSAEIIDLGKRRDCERAIMQIKKGLIGRDVVKELCWKASSQHYSEHQKAIYLAYLTGKSDDTTTRWLRGETRAYVEDFWPVIMMAYPRASMPLINAILGGRDAD